MLTAAAAAILREEESQSYIKKLESCRRDLGITAALLRQAAEEAPWLASYTIHLAELLETAAGVPIDNAITLARLGPPTPPPGRGAT